MPIIRIRAVISGTVQGVGFRAWVVRQARALQLGGWVRNLPSGEVEAEFEGEQSVVDKMTALLGDGPSGALVSNVHINVTPITGNREFEIHRGDW